MTFPKKRGVGPRQCCEAGACGALGDERTRSSLQCIGSEFAWTAAARAVEPQ